MRIPIRDIVGYALLGMSTDTLALPLLQRKTETILACVVTGFLSLPHATHASAERLLP